MFDNVVAGSAANVTDPTDVRQWSYAEWPEWEGYLSFRFERAAPRITASQDSVTVV